MTILKTASLISTPKSMPPKCTQKKLFITNPRQKIANLPPRARPSSMRVFTARSMPYSTARCGQKAGRCTKRSQVSKNLATLTHSPFLKYPL